MIAPPLALLPAAVAAALTAVAVGPVLRRLPEPPPSEPDADQKIPYAELADGRFALACGLVSIAFGWTAWALLPLRLQPPWLVLATLGVVLAMIDLRTTWLPLRLCRVGWAAMSTAIAVSAGLSADGWILVRGLLGGLAAGALYAIVWAISRGGFGFGDVRYAPLIGVAAASVSWTTLIWAILLGSVVGGVCGVAVRLHRRRSGPFPYAPSMLLGCYLALWWSTLV